MEEFSDLILQLTLVIPRLLACFTALPILSKRVLGGTLVRNGVALSLAVFLFPLALEERWPAEYSGWWLGAVLLKETLLGFLIGFIAAIPFWAIEATGFFIDNQRGATMASSLNLALGEQTSPLGLFLAQILVTLFFVSTAFLSFLGALFKSYLSWPVTTFFPSLTLDWVQFFYDQMAHLLVMVVLLAAPIILAMFLAEFALALASRSAPQLNVFFLAMPIKSGVAALLLIFYIHILVGYFSDEIFTLSQIPSQLNDWFQVSGTKP